MEYSIKPQEIGRKENNPLPSKEDNWIIRVKWFEQRGQFKDKSYVPAAGDIIFFDWGGDGKVDHVGIVEKVVDGTIHTIEGNSGDKVKRRNYSIGKTSIYGYGIY